MAFGASATNSGAYFFDGDSLRLQQLAMGQQHAQFLTAEWLDMHPQTSRAWTSSGF
jgi:hypothetical protein